MSKTKIILVLAVFLPAVGAAVGAAFLIKGNIFFESKESTPVEKERPASKRPDNFTEGVWIKKYPGPYACFKFETPAGIKIVCDPFGMDETSAPDIVTESHQDADHVDVSKLTGSYRLFKGPGNFGISTVKGIRIAGIPGQHNRGDAAATNTIFVFDINGVTIAHFASQGQVPSDGMWRRLEGFKGIDVLLIQCITGGVSEHLKMSVGHGCLVIDRLNPKIVIPEHGTARSGEAFARYYKTKVEYIDKNGLIITKDILESIKGHRIIDMDNKGPTD